MEGRERIYRVKKERRSLHAVESNPSEAAVAGDVAGKKSMLDLINEAINYCKLLSGPVLKKLI